VALAAGAWRMGDPRPVAMAIERIWTSTEAPALRGGAGASDQCGAVTAQAPPVSFSRSACSASSLASVPAASGSAELAEL
jgi:hypothetical protein